MQTPEFPIFNTEQFQNKDLVLFEEKKDPEQILDELFKKTPFLHTSSELLREKIEGSVWQRIQDEALKLNKTGTKWRKSSQQDEEQPKMITPISFVPPSPEEKLRMNETVDEDFTTPLNSFNTIAQKLKIPEQMKKKKEGEEGLEDLKEKRKVKPTESLKSPYVQRVVVMKNKVQEMEKRVADTIFSARGDLE